MREHVMPIGTRPNEVDCQVVMADSHLIRRSHSIFVTKCATLEAPRGFIMTELVFQIGHRGEHNAKLTYGIFLLEHVPAVLQQGASVGITFQSQQRAVVVTPSAGD